MGDGEMDRCGLTVTENREKNKLPIFTMFLASQKVYLVNSPALISQINRKQKVIDSNEFFLTIVFGKLFGFHGDNLAELFKNAGKNGSLRRDSMVLEHSLLERGVDSLNEVFTMIMSGLADRLNTVAREGPVTMNLQAFLREIFTLSTAQGLFGPKNPFTHDPNLVNDFW